MNMAPRLAQVNRSRNRILEFIVPFTLQELERLPRVLSIPRFATYLRACADRREAALELYLWNMEVSAAFMVPLHICEIAIRNAVAEAIEQIHGPHWPWTAGFLISLPKPRDTRQYDPAQNLAQVAQRERTTGKVVAAINFAFWEKLFTRGQDGRMWSPCLRTVLPGAPQDLTIPQIRQDAFVTLQRIRRLRNRIAHHEPIFARELAEDYVSALKLIRWRCSITAHWVDDIQQVRTLLDRRPV